MDSSQRTATGSVALHDARRALVELLPRFTTLLRRVHEPFERAIGTWTIGDVAAHVAHVADVNLMSALGKADPLASMGLPDVKHVTDVAKLNAANLQRDVERDPITLAERISELVGYLIEHASSGDDRTCEWLFGARIPLSAVCSHMTSEMSIHGRDIARAARLPWTIDPNHARIAVEGFYLQLMSAVPVGPTGPGVTESSCEIRARGGTPWVIVQTSDGVHVELPGRKVDLHMVGDPVAMLLVMTGRVGQLQPVFRGQIFAWGRHPLRAMRMLNAIGRP